MCPAVMCGPLAVFSTSSSPCDIRYIFSPSPCRLQTLSQCQRIAFLFIFEIARPVSGTELEEPDFKDLSECVPSPPWSSTVRAPAFGQTDIQDKPKRQTIRAHHPDLSPGFQALACTSAFTGKATQFYFCLLSFLCVHGHSCSESGSTVTTDHSSHAHTLTIFWC